jgi:phosphoserine phosphatase
MARLVHQMFERAARLWIVSASPQAVAEGCGDLLQFPRRNILATVVEPGPHGNPRFPWKQDKLAVLHAAGVHRPLLVFGNGLEDCEMLEAASIPIAMADGNSKLLEVAGERHWQILGPRTKVEFTP